MQAAAADGGQLTNRMLRKRLRQHGIIGEGRQGKAKTLVKGEQQQERAAVARAILAFLATHPPFHGQRLHCITCTCVYCVCVCVCVSLRRK